MQFNTRQYSRVLTCKVNSRQCHSKCMYWYEESVCCWDWDRGPLRLGEGTSETGRGDLCDGDREPLGLGERITEIRKRRIRDGTKKWNVKRITDPGKAITKAWMLYQTLFCLRKYISSDNIHVTGWKTAPQIHDLNSMPHFCITEWMCLTKILEPLYNLLL